MTADAVKKIRLSAIQQKQHYSQPSAIGACAKMTNLNSLVEVRQQSGDDEVEDIFASAIGTIFTDDLMNMHGDASSTIKYKSQRFGPIELTCADSEDPEALGLFGQYLWNAGIMIAELISQESGPWAVKGETVIELGAGALCRVPVG